MRLAAGREQRLLQSPAPFLRKICPPLSSPSPPALPVAGGALRVMGTFPGLTLPIHQDIHNKVIPKIHTAFLDLRLCSPDSVAGVHTRVWRAQMAVLCHVKLGISSETQGFLGSRMAYFTRS